MMAEKKEQTLKYVVKTLAMTGRNGKKIERYISKEKRVLNIVTEEDFEPRTVKTWIENGFLEKAKASDVKAFEKFIGDKKKPKKKASLTSSEDNKESDNEDSNKGGSADDQGSAGPNDIAGPSGNNDSGTSGDEDSKEDKKNDAPEKTD